MTPEEVRLLITNSSKPLVFKNVLKWDISNWNLSHWKVLLKNVKMDFRGGYSQMTREPQWERQTDSVTMTFEQFLERIELETNKWYYFDYKYLNSNLLDADRLRKDISWECMGFPEIKPDDCTIWIGSKGAHTPCHKDTYGFNLIHQIYGRKLWLLFPPEENLRPTRIPYEESSVYSQLNFFSPLLKDFQGIGNCRMVILEPGDVLYLPHHWWHYVENLETSITINSWMPLPIDDEERLREALVQLFVKQMSTISSEETNKYILNPNMEQILKDNYLKTFEVFNQCKNIYQCQIQSAIKKFASENKTQNHEIEPNVNQLLEKYSSIREIPKLTNSEFLQFLKKQNERFEYNADGPIHPSTENNQQEVQQAIVDFLKVVTDTDVINLIKDKLTNK